MKFVWNKNLFAILFIFIIPLFSLAQGSETPRPTSAPPGGSETPRAESPAGSLSYKLENPLQFDTIQDFIVAVLNVIIVIATPIVVIFIIFAGFKYVTARGNAGEIQKATQALTYAVIGGVLIIGAVAIAEIIKNLVTAFAA